MASGGSGFEQCVVLGDSDPSDYIRRGMAQAFHNAGRMHSKLREPFGEMSVRHGSLHAWVKCIAATASGRKQKRISIWLFVGTDAKKPRGGLKSLRFLTYRYHSQMALRTLLELYGLYSQWGTAAIQGRTTRWRANGYISTLNLRVPLGECYLACLRLFYLSRGSVTLLLTSDMAIRSGRAPDQQAIAMRRLLLLMVLVVAVVLGLCADLLLS